MMMITMIMLSEIGNILPHFELWGYRFEKVTRSLRWKPHSCINPRCLSHFASTSV